MKVSGNQRRVGSGIQLRDMQSYVEIRVMGDDLRLQVVMNIDRDTGNDCIGLCGLKVEHDGENLSIVVGEGYSVTRVCGALCIFGKFTSKTIESCSFFIGRVLITDSISLVDIGLFRFFISFCVDFYKLYFSRNLSISPDFSDKIIII